MQPLLEVIWICRAASKKVQVFSGGLHLNIYAQKPLGLPKLANLALNDNQNGVTKCYQIAIHNVTFGCSVKDFRCYWKLKLVRAYLAKIEPA